MLGWCGAAHIRADSDTPGTDVTTRDKFAQIARAQQGARRGGLHRRGHAPLLCICIGCRKGHRSAPRFRDFTGCH